ncbi:MAG TPA: hypothetical protein VK980_06980 [Sphingomonas sp.]|nr:hypothetical protein [Sphingomonas sp.]
MLKNLVMPLSLTLLLAGCDASPPQPKPTPTAPKIDYLARINKLTPQQRSATFYRAIEDAGFICDSVAASDPQDPVQGHPAWDARCGDGQHWTLVLFDDGILQVLKAGRSSDDSAGAPGNKM